MGFEASSGRRSQESETRRGKRRLTEPDSKVRRSLARGTVHHVSKNESVPFPRREHPLEELSIDLPLSGLRLNGKEVLSAQLVIFEGGN